VLQSVLSAHTFLIAAIFVPYIVLMGALFLYIARTAAHEADDPPDTSGKEDGRAVLPLAV
jgi:hypothetical protein